jgi:hypothetical protein
MLDKGSGERWGPVLRRGSVDLCHGLSLFPRYLLRYCQPTKIRFAVTTPDPKESQGLLNIASLGYAKT